MTGSANVGGRPVRRPIPHPFRHRFPVAARLPAVAAVLGLLHALTFAPWGNWGLALLVLAAQAALLRTAIGGGRPLGAIALTGGAFGFGWFLAGVGWLYVSMHTYGAMPAPLAALALVLFAAYLALFPAVAAAATGWLCRFAAPTGGPVPPLVFAGAFASTLTLAEGARGLLFTGFPWLAPGYAQVDGPLAGFAPVGGVQAVGFAAAAVAALAVGALSTALSTRLPVPVAGRPDGSARRAILPAVLALVITVTGAALASLTWSEPAGAPLRVRLIQGNVPQQMKFEATTVQQTMRRYLEWIEAEPADLIVLPETAWTMPWSATPVDLAQRLERFITASGSAVAIGMPLIVARTADGADGRPSLANSVLMFDRRTVSGSADPARYDKHHLVPFGEFVPWGFRWFVDLMTIPLGDFARGAAVQAPFLVGEQRIAFNICYEDVFGEELLPALRGPEGATILANISNIAWFGDSHALDQHRQIARMRALETARPMIRATNTGVTAAIDHDGTVIAELPPFHAGSLAVTVQGRRGLTPYARTGNRPVAGVALGLVLFLAVIGAARRGGRGRLGGPGGPA